MRKMLETNFGQPICFWLLRGGKKSMCVVLGYSSLYNIPTISFKKSSYLKRTRVPENSLSATRAGYIYKTGWNFLSLLPFLLFLRRGQY